MIPFAIYLTYWLKISNQIFTKLSHYTWIPILISIFSIPLYLTSGQYKSITRYFSSQVVYFIAFRNLILLFLVSLTGYILKFQQPKLNTWILIWLLITTLSSSVRLFIRDIISTATKKTDFSKKIAIYGAGQTGALLSNNLKLKNFKLKFFIDDDPNLWKRSLNGVDIFPPSYLEKNHHEIDQVLVAIPNIKRTKLKDFINWISNLNLKAYQVPSIEMIAKGKTIIDQLKPVTVEELLGREIVPPDLNLINSAIKNKTILITGGGGSIGSELFKQISNFNPLKVVLLDNNENSIYKLQLIIDKLPKKNKYDVILASVCDRKIIKGIFSKYKFDLIYHAAAYKHVPIVEENALFGLINNICATKIITEEAINFKIKKVMLISSDKAVRPTNLMGVSKRVSELIFQNETLNEFNKSTIFSIVRFGNVLNSSGSVVPLFKKQIKNGGPITITNKNITRYFMTIKEATELVIQSSSLANGGEIFLLEMGDPVKIIDLAKQMILLSGLKIKDKNNINGDIEIKEIGLRPGEKLFEELLIDNRATKTNHPLIYISKEIICKKDLISMNIKKLIDSLLKYDEKNMIFYLKKLVPEWTQYNNKK